MIMKGITASREVDDNHGELVKSAQLGNFLVSVQVFSDPDLPLLGAWKPKDCRKTSRDFAKVKRVLEKIAKRCAAMAVFMGGDTEEALWSRISYPSYSALLAVHKGKMFLEVLPVHHLEGFSLDLRPELYLNNNTVRLRHAEEPEPEEAESPAFCAAPDVARDDIGGLQDGNSSLNHNHKVILLNSISVIRRQLPQPNLGWPLLLRKSLFQKPETRDISVVEWALSLPNRVTTVVNQIALHSNQTSVNSETNTIDSTINDHNSEAKPVINDNRSSKDESSELDYNAEVSVSLNTKDLESYLKPGWPLLRIKASTTSDSFSELGIIKIPMVESVIVSTKVENHVQIENCLPSLGKMLNDSKLHCKQFSLMELKQATSGFSPENFIGEGGCSNVYKGCLLGGKPVAVKVLKSYKEAWSDFSLEVDIVSLLKHKHITPLIGVCVEDDNLISVYDFFPRGSLEEILHGENKKSVLPWGIRFKVAMAIAEALNYLHNECFPSVIHRDVKSSNILLSDDFQPQLSDFGLAIRGPIDSTYMIDSNVVGTFGYIAPEYLMEGRVSDKIDVYSFGVVLLELVSGRRPISSKAQKGQESFIQWARALLERRNLQGLVDPALDGDFDLVQMRRVVLAASLCLNQLDGYRPKVSQILEILRGEKEQSEWSNFHATDLKVPNDQEDDQLPPEFVHKFYTYLSVSFKKDDSTSKCSNYIRSRCRAGKEHRLKLKSYLKKKQRRSYSLS